MILVIVNQDSIGWFIDAIEFVGFWGGMRGFMKRSRTGNGHQQPVTVDG
jgi:hypothetical protein